MRGAALAVAVAGRTAAMSRTVGRANFRIIYDVCRHLPA
jgi:hypothetical protein